MNFESGITIVWMLPVFLQIVLPLILLLFFGIGKGMAIVFGFSSAEKKTASVQAIDGKQEVPTAGAIA